MHCNFLKNRKTGGQIVKKFNQLIDNLKIISKPSPNFGIRRDKAYPSIIVLHYTAMESANDALERLCDPEAEVSSHYLIDEQGKIFSLVDEEHRAWHAGEGSWGDCEDINSSSIGIELSNSGEAPFSFPLMQSLVFLINKIINQWNIKPNDIIGHSDLAPGRKKDPGRHFDWAWLEFLELASKSVSINSDYDFWKNLEKLGYMFPVLASQKLDVLEAFRARHCQNNYGPINEKDIFMASGVVKRLKNPV